MVPEPGKASDKRILRALRVVSDLEEFVSMKHEGTVMIGRYKFWTSSYADDVVLLVKDELEFELMIGKFM